MSRVSICAPENGFMVFGLAIQLGLNCFHLLCGEGSRFSLMIGSVFMISPH